MTKISGWLTAVLLAGAMAIPASALAQLKSGSGNGGHPVAHGGGGGGGHAVSGERARRSFGGGGRSFTPHASGRSTNFRAVNRGTTSNRSVLRSQGLQRNTRTLRNTTTTRTLRNTTAVQTNTQRALRRNGAAAITPLAARQGRFGSRFAARTGNARFANVAAHRAWRRGLRAGFVGWYGPVFWPYAYSDIFDYAFWPGGYDDGYWDYAYDDFIDGLFWGEYGPPDDIRLCRAGRAGARELCRRAGTVQAARHRHHRLAVLRHRTQGRPQRRAESFARRRAQGRRRCRRHLQGVMPVRKRLPADAAGPADRDDGPAAGNARCGDRSFSPRSTSSTLR